MISKLELKNFKLFKERTIIPFSNVNLLTGINGKGKSTVFQSLLLMMQSPEYDRTTNKIYFNGDYVKLGSFNDVKNIQTPMSESDIEFVFYYDKFSIKYVLQRNENDLMIGEIKEISVEGTVVNEPCKFKLIHKDGLYEVVKELQKENYPDPFPISLHNLFISEASLIQYYENFDCEEVKRTINFSKIHYVSADRVGPQLFYKENSLKEFYSVGPLGEDTINVLFQLKNTTVEECFIESMATAFNLKSEDLGKTVEFQTALWLSKIFGDTKYEIKESQDANLLIFRLSPDGTFNYYKPTNVGYGYTYVLPIIVAGLIAKPGEILIVENPEAHLHPAAQSMMAKFLALVSLNGVQIFVESHSEHILNGFRVAIYDEMITPGQLNVLYFDNASGNYFQKISVDKEGGINNWPPNFFDQATKDLNYLFGI